MAILKRDGANISYTTIGTGPLFIFIPGANGTGDIFTQAAEFMKSKFKVVLFDRRGYGKSELTAPLPKTATQPDSTYRIKTDASDVDALAQALSPDKPVYILGSSSGAIVAMEVLQDYPDIVAKIAFHEPPINSFLASAEHDQAQNNQIVATAETKGMLPAMMLFGKAMKIGALDAKMMGKSAEDPNSKRAQAMKFWAQYEIRQYTSRKINLANLQRFHDQIVLFNGTDSKGSYPQTVNQSLSQYLDLPIFDIPGGHLGYAQKPEGFATTVEAAFLS